MDSRIVMNNLYHMKEELVEFLFNNLLTFPLTTIFTKAGVDFVQTKHYSKFSIYIPEFSPYFGFELFNKSYG